jgi:hypothetical protein
MPANEMLTSHLGTKFWFVRLTLYMHDVRINDHMNFHH